LAFPCQGAPKKGRLAVSRWPAAERIDPALGEGRAVQASEFEKSCRDHFIARRNHAALARSRMRYRLSPDCGDDKQATFSPSFLRGMPLVMPRTEWGCQ
jgi:hypothetical protein